MLYIKKEMPVKADENAANWSQVVNWWDPTVFLISIRVLFRLFRLFREFIRRCPRALGAKGKPRRSRALVPVAWIPEYLSVPYMHAYSNDDQSHAAFCSRVSPPAYSQPGRFSPPKSWRYSLSPTSLKPETTRVWATVGDPICLGWLTEVRLTTPMARDCLAFHNWLWRKFDTAKEKKNHFALMNTACLAIKGVAR